MKIGIISGSIREQNKTATVADFIAQAALERQSNDVAYELIDLADYDVPLLESPVHPMAAGKQYSDPNRQKWSDAIDACDAFVLVTPEYNHGVPGALKNAVDNLGPEWVGKPVAFVGHGSVGGVRAIEQWRQILANFSMPMLRTEMNFNMFYDWNDGEFTPQSRHHEEAKTLLAQLEELVKR